MTSCPHEPHVLPADRLASNPPVRAWALETAPAGKEAEGDGGRFVLHRGPLGVDLHIVSALVVSRRWLRAIVIIGGMVAVAGLVLLVVFPYRLVSSFASEAECIQAGGLFDEAARSCSVQVDVSPVTYLILPVTLFLAYAVPIYLIALAVKGLRHLLQWLFPGDPIGDLAADTEVVYRARRGRRRSSRQ